MLIGSILVMGGLGVFVGVGLALASKIFYVYVDPKVEAIDEALPGANCGGCGLPGCSANAVAIVEGKASASSCVAGGPEIAAEIAEIMGVALENREPDIARPGCTYGIQDADAKFLYDGVIDCRAAALLSGGSKVCPIGCLGLGTCVRACPFDAIKMGADHLPVVDPNLCTGCGTCERVCPKSIITLSSHSRRIQLEHTTDQCTAPCQRACPAGIDIPSYIGQIAVGDYLGALRTIKETNPFPSVCGRICIQPCELVCRRNLVDEPLAINHLKRFAADFEMNSGTRVHVPRAPETGKRVAVIGGGVEGLTAAYLLNRLGHDTTVYESGTQIGGLLHAGIPENRLPRNVLDWEIKGIQDAGVHVFTNKTVGKDIGIDSLISEGFSAVFMAVGGWDTVINEGMKGEMRGALPGLWLLIDFLINPSSDEKSNAGEHIFLLEGGKAALDAARILAKRDAEKVCIVTRLSRDEAPFSDADISEAEKEGICFYFQYAVTRLGGENDKLTHLELSNLRHNGEGEKGDIHPCELLLAGAGRFPELIYVPEIMAEDETRGEGEKPVKWETLTPYASPAARADMGIFRPGEVISDYKAVVEAIGAGRRAAASIHKTLTGQPLVAPDNMIRSFTHVLSIDRLEPIPTGRRQKMPQRTDQEGINDPSMEVMLGYSEDQARKEAARCLQCGLICYCRIEESHRRHHH